ERERRRHRGDDRAAPLRGEAGAVPEPPAECAGGGEGGGDAPLVQGSRGAGASSRPRPAPSEGDVVIGRDREAAILRLYHAEKWRVGTIAAQLGLHHSTVRRVLAQAGLDAGRVSVRPSMADPYVPF